MIFKVGRIAHSRLNLNQFNSTFSCHQTHRDLSSIHTNSQLIAHQAINIFLQVILLICLQPLQFIFICKYYICIVQSLNLIIDKYFGRKKNTTNFINFGHKFQEETIKAYLAMFYKIVLKKIFLRINLKNSFKLFLGVIFFFRKFKCEKQLFQFIKVFKIFSTFLIITQKIIKNMSKLF